MEILHLTRMADSHLSEEINAEYQTKIPVFDADVDDADSEDYLLHKVTCVPQKVFYLQRSSFSN